MTDPLDTLRPEVREAVAAIDNGNGVFVNADDCIGSEKWKIVRAELLRLADENKRMRGIIETLDVEGHRRAEKAEAELAAVRARIAESQECAVVALCGGGISLSHEPRESLVGKRVRLLVDEPQDDNAQEGRSRE